MAEAYFLDTKYGDLYFDVVIRERTTARSQVTMHPVEYGANISDHMIREPKEFVFEGGVTDTQLRTDDSDPLGVPGANRDTRMERAWRYLQDIKDSANIFNVQTNLELIRNVVIKELSVTQEAATSRVLNFVGTLQEIIYTETEEVALPPGLLNREIQKAGSATNRGVQQVEEVPESGLFKLLGFGG